MNCCARIPAHARTMMSASQNGKKPLFGPSVPQPMPKRIASKMTRPPSKARTDAVITSALRMLVFQQAPFGHQIAVQFFVFFNPLDVFSAGGESGFESAL